MTVYIIPIEPIDTRYTRQWYDHLPKKLRELGAEVIVIDGIDVPPVPTPGAFLDFAATNIYKSSQLESIGRLFQNQLVKNGDYFLYTDAWNPTVIQLRYMADLFGVKINIGGIWHAGSYDPQDFLGRLIGDAPWVRYAENSMFTCYNHNFFATNFHIDLFKDVVYHSNYESIIRSGQPYEYMRPLLSQYNIKKKQKIIFPHRLAPEKQVDIFKDLAESLPQFEWFIAQEHSLTKDEYYKHMAESKLVFSANLQETLGLSAYEGACLGALPVVPSRLSYPEIWTNDFSFYPTEWTTSFEAYAKYKDELADYIYFLMTAVEDLDDIAIRDAAKAETKYYNGQVMYNTIMETVNV